ncbi:phage portal protein [Limosilactobacillus reuteri]|uniref:phage portal protein n=1 Tax=Limosilactobacillus reuteri TaxID=1598 RepID=UPI00128B3EAA|nr:phage portal protein [Limosilactobacillus reuteri]MQB59170.1 phage portal protein [Limosilactobacillus reuteri]MQB82628.1 phage portal protein [Limosilactobacillus reuteri]
MEENKGQVVEGNVFIYPKDKELTMPDLLKFIGKNKNLADEYRHNLKMYKGNHDILNKQPRQFGPDNKLVANLPHYIVDTYNGFFTGIPPKVTLDDKETNTLLQEWNDENSLQDKLSEISKQADIFGRSLAFVYQDEDSQTRIAYSSPIDSFMIYDDTVSRQPLAFVRYWKNTDGIQVGMVYYSDKTISFEGSKFGDEMLNPYKMVPAVEFYGNEERQGVFDNVKTLIDELDRVLSQKANQVEYFDNAYLKILGVDLDQDGDGKPDADLIGNQMIYSPDADATNATVDFISKPDGDNMQEHIIDRLVSMIYQISMVANLNDEAFAGNSSGVALQYKLLPMRNMAANKERKFRQALRRLYRIVFSVGTVLPEVHSEDWRELVFTFKRNLPDDISNDADIAQKLQGMVSQETLLSILPFVNDPQEEIKRINKEKQENMQQALKYGPAALDQDKPDGDEDGDAE